MKQSTAYLVKRNKPISKIYQFGFDSTYKIAHAIEFVLRFAPLAVLTPICIWSRAAEQRRANICLANREASLEIRGVLDDAYDIIADFHCSVHFTALNRFAVDPCHGMAA